MGDNNKLNNPFGGSEEGFAENLVDGVLNSAIGSTNTFALQQKAAYLSGARVTMRINDKLAGFAFQFTWRIDTAQDEIRTIDDYVAWEYAPKFITIEGTIGMLHMPGKGPVSEKIMPALSEFLFNKYISIEVRDKATDELIFFTPKAVITSRNETLQAEQLANISLSFKAIAWKEELSVGFPTDYNKTQDEAKGKDSFKGLSLPNPLFK